MIVPASVTRAAPVFTAPVVISAKTARVVIVIPRPTSAGSVSWPSNRTLKVTAEIVVDGVTHFAAGQVTGGVRVNRRGNEIGVYRLTWSPTMSYRSDAWRRLCEQRTTATARLRIELLSGASWSGNVQVFTEEEDAPQPERHNSVAFDAVSSEQEAGGDGVLSWSHTASGSDRAVFVAAGHSQSGGAGNTTSATYGGNAMTEMWDFGAEIHYRNAGYYFVAPATSAQTVAVTASAAADEFGGGAISMTGVDQTTPVGTPATGSGSTGAPSVAVSTPASDSLVVDHLYDDGSERTVGANQTQRWAELSINGFTNSKGSTQSGSDGGTMSWSSLSQPWLLGAVEFLAAAGAPASASLPPSRYPIWPQILVR